MFTGPYTFVMREKDAVTKKDFDFVYDAKLYMINQIDKLYSKLWNDEEVSSYTLFAGFPFDVRVNVTPSLNIHAIETIENMIRNMPAGDLFGKRTLTIQFKHYNDDSRNIVFTLSYNEGYDE